MADYKQQSTSVDKYNRFSTITILNPLNRAPLVSALEEQVLSISGETILRQVGEINKPFNPYENFPERDPATGELTGNTLSSADVYKAIYSYVVRMAEERDAALL